MRVVDVHNDGLGAIPASLALTLTFVPSVVEALAGAMRLGAGPTFHLFQRVAIGVRAASR